MARNAFISDIHINKPILYRFATAIFDLFIIRISIDTAEHLCSNPRSEILPSARHERLYLGDINKELSTISTENEAFMVGVLRSAGRYIIRKTFVLIDTIFVN